MLSVGPKVLVVLLFPFYFVLQHCSLIRKWGDFVNCSEFFIAYSIWTLRSKNLRICFPLFSVLLNNE